MAGFNDQLANLPVMSKNSYRELSKDCGRMRPVPATMPSVEDLQPCGSQVSTGTMTIGMVRS